MPLCAHDETFLAYHDCQGDDRRIHALVVGVGRYHEAAPRFGTSLNSLPGAALAAYRFAHYLINEFQFQEPRGRRLATVRMLLSPLDREDVAALRYGPAERKEVAVALQDWADDCNTDDQNLAVLYVAGHGVALGKSTSLLFLADAPGERSPAQAAVNLTLTEMRMSDCAAKQNLFFYDCCAVPESVVPHNQSGALAIDEFSGSDGGKRVSLVCVNAARVGTKTYAIGPDGTLLARGLLGDYRDRAGADALLRIAGELVPSPRFGITPTRLSQMLPQCLEGLASERKIPEGYEPTLTTESADGIIGQYDPIAGRYEPDVITVPAPTPMFKVTLRELRSGRTPPVAVTLLDTQDRSIPLATDADDVEVKFVPPGDYMLQVSSSGGPPMLKRLVVIGPIDRAVPG
jgi:hypothetical protein